MSEMKTVEAGQTSLSACEEDEGLTELGQASRETRGLFFGVTAEISIIPWRLI